MNVHRIIRIALATAAIAVLALPATALGAGEPKNVLPFTHPSARTVAVVGVPARSIAGEPKNEPPFTREATSTIVIVRGHGFAWADAAVGAAAVAGIGLAGLGLWLLLGTGRSRVRAGTAIEHAR